MRYGPYTCVYRSIWDEPAFWELSYDAKLVLLYVWTAPMGNGIGCFKAGMGAMSEEFRMEQARYISAFKECLRSNFYEYDDYSMVVLIPKYFKRNSPRNSNGLSGMSKDFIKIPDCELKLKCWEIVSKWVEDKTDNFKKVFENCFPKPVIKTSAFVNEGINETVNQFINEPVNEGINLDKSPCPSPSPRQLLPNGNKKEKSKPKKNSPYSPSFEAFWSVYPKQRSKGDANKAWGQMKKNGNWPGDDVVIEALKRLSVSPDWIADGGKFVPYPGKWLRAAGWEDEPTTKTNGQLEYDFSEYEEIMKKMEVAK
jgi:hypothetical protein